jgi:hypothetical protein
LSANEIVVEIIERAVTKVDGRSSRLIVDNESDDMNDNTELAEALCLLLGSDDCATLASESMGEVDDIKTCLDDNESSPTVDERVVPRLVVRLDSYFDVV